MHGRWAGAAGTGSSGGSGAVTGSLVGGGGVTIIILITAMVVTLRKPPVLQASGKDAIAKIAKQAEQHLKAGKERFAEKKWGEAKSELEHALTLQPRDPKGQDLLAVVYFRIGLYPHAIQIYEELLRQNPNDHSLRLNLALCCLKTGQAQAARELSQN